VSSDLDDDMLEAIGLSKVFSTVEGAEVRLEAIDMEDLNDAGIEMASLPEMPVMENAYTSAMPNRMALMARTPPMPPRYGPMY
jgi:hypothetical protein